MKLISIFNLLREGSIKDFNFSYFISDKFIVPFIKGEITSDNYVLIDSFNDDFNLNLNETNILSHPKFKQYAINWIKDRINEFRFETKNLINPTTGVIKIYRGMSVNENWLHHLQTQGKRLGIYWSWTPNGAIQYGGDYEGDFAVIECEIDEKYVDWENTIFQNIVLETEREITLLKNTPIKLLSIEINDEMVDISSLKNKTFTS